MKPSKDIAAYDMVLFKGLDSFGPSTLIKETYSPSIENFEVSSGMLKVRDGLQSRGETIPGNVHEIVEFNDWNGGLHTVALSSSGQFLWTGTDWTSISTTGAWNVTGTSVSATTGLSVDWTGGGTSPNWIDAATGYDWTVITDDNGRHLVVTNTVDPVVWWDGVAALFTEYTIVRSSTNPLGLLGFKSCVTFHSYYSRLVMGNVVTRERCFDVTETSATWDQGTATLTMAAAFTGYTPVAGDQIWLETGIDSGFYTVVSKTSVNALVLDSAHANATGIAINGIYSGVNVEWNSQFVAWNSLGDLLDFSGPCSGFAVIPDLVGPIVRLLPLRQVLLVYTTHSIGSLTYLGSDAAEMLYALDSRVQHTDLTDGRAIVDLGTMHVLMTSHGFTAYDGTTFLRSFGRVAQAEVSSPAWGLWDSSSGRTFWGTEGKVLVMSEDTDDPRLYNWTSHDYGTVSGAGVTEDGLWLVSEGLACQESELSSEENFEALFETKDFTVPTEFLSSYARWSQVEIETQGTGSVEVSYSVNYGETWTSVGTIVSTELWSVTKLDFDVTSHVCRLRLEADPGLSVRWLKLWLVPGGAN